MRILLLNNIFPPGYIGGYELGALDMARGLAGRGHEVEVLTSDFFMDDAGEMTDLTVRRVLEYCDPNLSPAGHPAYAEAAAFLNPRNIRLLAGEIAVFRPDRVLCFNLAGLGTPGILQYLSALGCRPVLFFMDNLFAAMLEHPARLERFRRVFGVGRILETTHPIFMSGNLRAEIETALGEEAERAGIVPGWVGRAASGTPRLRRGGMTRFVFASRIAWHKGSHLVLEAARLLTGLGHVDFVIDVFGTGATAEMLQTIAATGLTGYVRYQGNVDRQDLIGRLSGYEALLFPTWQREPFGFIVCEGAAAGCLPIMTHTIGAAEWYLDGVDCLKIPREPEALATAMLRVMTMPDNELWEMRDRARAITARLLTFDRALDRLQAALAVAAAPDHGAARRAEAAMTTLAHVWRALPND
jgi:glycosyltransferase involved in cell wall biosynthesis